MTTFDDRSLLVSAVKTCKFILLHSWLKCFNGGYLMASAELVLLILLGLHYLMKRYASWWMISWSWISWFADTVHVFSIHESEFGFHSLAPLILLCDQRNGFIVNDTCIIEAEVGVRKAEAKILEDQSSSISASMEALSL